MGQFEDNLRKYSNSNSTKKLQSVLLSGDAGGSGRGDLNEMRLMFVLLGGSIYFTLSLF